MNSFQTCRAKIWIKGFSVTSFALLTIVFIKFSSFLTSYCKSESLHLSLTILGLLRCLKRLLWMGWMVIIGHRSSKNTYSANKMRDNSRYHWDTSQRRPFYYWWCNVDDRRVLWFRPKSNQMPSQPRTFFIFSVWQVFHIATHKVCPEQSSVTLSSIQKQLTSVKAMRSLYLLGFFGLFASLHPSVVNPDWPCQSFFELREGNVVGRGFKNFDNYTQIE